MAAFQKKMKSKMLQMRFVDTSAQRLYDGEAIPRTDAQADKMVGWDFYKGDFPWVADVSGLKTDKMGKSKVFTIPKKFNTGIIVLDQTIHIPKIGRYMFKLRADGPTVLKM